VSTLCARLCAARHSVLPAQIAEYLSCPPTAVRGALPSEISNYALMRSPGEVTGRGVRRFPHPMPWRPGYTKSQAGSACAPCRLWSASSALAGIRSCDLQRPLHPVERVTAGTTDRTEIFIRPRRAEVDGQRRAVQLWLFLRRAPIISGTALQGPVRRGHDGRRLDPAFLLVPVARTNLEGQLV
jgi:hypothetical protein